MKYCFILNPAAGKGRAVEELEQNIQATCQDKQVNFEIYRTVGVGDASEYVKRTVALNPLEQYRFYACGGDGTLCEVVNGVMALEDHDRASVGLIPSGTGNDFARNFTYGENFFNIEAQISAQEEPIDLLHCGDMYAINMINIGFDCEVVCKTAELKRKRWIPSKFAYIAGLIRTLIRKPGMKASISKNGGDREDKRYLLATFANGSFCGGGFYSNPKGSLNDGTVDTLFVENITRARFISLVKHYKRGTHLTPQFEKIIHNEKLARVDLYFKHDTNISVDGEIVSAREFHITPAVQALRFLIPEGSKMIGDHKEQDDIQSVSVESAMGNTVE